MVDANNQVIGQLMAPPSLGAGAVVVAFSVITPTGYTLVIHSDGAFPTFGALYFSGNNCTGTPSFYGSTLAKTVIPMAGAPGGDLWIPSPAAVNQYGVSPGSVVSYLSYYQVAGGCISGPGGPTASAMTAVTNAQLGLPATITPPLTLQ